MVCGAEAANDIASVVGTKPIEPLTPTWVDHLYSCRYIYLNGTMVLSVKELANATQTGAYFNALHRQLGQRQWLKDVAQGAFLTPNGSEVVRKDYKVLLVDTSGLPAHIGHPPATRSNIAVGVGLTVLGCWTGA